MNIRLVGIIVESMILSAICVGQDRLTDSLLTFAIKFILGALIFGVVTHFSLKRLGL